MSILISCEIDRVIGQEKEEELWRRFSQLIDLDYPSSRNLLVFLDYGIESYMEEEVDQRCCGAFAIGVFLAIINI